MNRKIARALLRSRKYRLVEAFNKEAS